MLRNILIRATVFFIVLGIGLAVCLYDFQPYVSLDVDTDRVMDLVIFYDNGRAEDYRFDDQHMTAPYTVYPGRKTVTIKVPLESMERLRFDFGNEPCDVSVYGIQLVVSRTEMITLQGDGIVRTFGETQDIGTFEVDENGCIYYSVTGTDGYIAATEDLLSGSTHVLRDSFIRTLFLSVFGAILLSCMDLLFALGKRVLLFCQIHGKSIRRVFFKPENRLEYVCGACLNVLFAAAAAIFFDGVVLRLILKIVRLMSMDRLSRFFAAAEFFSWERAGFFFNIFLIISLCLWLGKSKAVRYRYALAVLLLVLMTAGQYTGSSLGYYDSMLHGNTEEYHNSTLLGIPQGIRGDEWATEKPYYFAQVNGGQNLPYYNENLMIDGADMVVSAFAPVKDLITIFRPSLLGFWFLQGANAFAFYWWWKIIVLFMAAFELCRLISGRNFYGLVGALVFTFAPPNQWWMSQAIIEMLAFGFYALVSYDMFLRASIRWKRCLMLVFTFYCLTGYILTMYPANQVPFAYVFLAVLIWIVWKNWDRKPFSARKVALYLIISMPFVGVLLRFAVMSGDAIYTQLHTIYPGSVRPWIPLTKSYPFYRLINLFTANIRHPDFLNSCEISQYFSFAVVLIPFMIWLIVHKWRKKELFLPIILFVFSTFLVLVTWLPPISFLNRITLLSMSYPVRITIAYGMGYTLTLISLLPKLEQGLSGVSHRAAVICCGTAGFLILCLATNIQEVFDYLKAFRLGPFLLIAEIVFFAAMSYFLVMGGKKYCYLFSVCLVALNILSTACVNPITHGTDSMFEKTTMQAIREINQEEPGRWIVSGSPTIKELGEKYIFN